MWVITALGERACEPVRTRNLVRAHIHMRNLIYLRRISWFGSLIAHCVVFGATATITATHVRKNIWPFCFGKKIKMIFCFLTKKKTIVRSDSLTTSKTIHLNKLNVRASSVALWLYYFDSFVCLCVCVCEMMRIFVYFYIVLIEIRLFICSHLMRSFHFNSDLSSLADTSMNIIDYDQIKVLLLFTW